MGAGAPEGNSNAVRGKVVHDAIRKAVIQGKRLEPLVNKLLDLAQDGDLTAINIVFDRLEGKPKQVLANDEESSFIIEIKR